MVKREKQEAPEFKVNMGYLETERQKIQRDRDREKTEWKLVTNHA